MKVEIRGGGNATRQINHIFTPDFPAHRLLLCEVYTPSGNWSSYPPHKHDVHNPPHEVDLEEIYYYRIDRPEGYAIQRVYTADRRLDDTITVRDGDLVLVPEGYHPVVAAHGYNVYYLNALAGSARSMAAADDPDLRLGPAELDGARGSHADMEASMQVRKGLSLRRVQTHKIPSVPLQETPPRPRRTYGTTPVPARN